MTTKGENRTLPCLTAQPDSDLRPDGRTDLGAEWPTGQTKRSDFLTRPDLAARRSSLEAPRRLPARRSVGREATPRQGV